MQKQEIFGWVVKTLTETFEIDATKITPEAELARDLDIDSIDAVDLMVKLKHLTGKRLQPEAFKSVRSVQDVVDVVYQQIHD